MAPPCGSATALFFLPNHPLMKKNLITWFYHQHERISSPGYLTRNFNSHEVWVY